MRNTFGYNATEGNRYSELLDCKCAKMSKAFTDVPGSKKNGWGKSSKLEESANIWL